MIKIIVMSTVGEGKSTIAMEIADHLQSKGFKCSINDDEPYSGNHQRRLDGVKAKGPIVIETKQAQRLLYRED